MELVRMNVIDEWNVRERARMNLMSCLLWSLGHHVEFYVGRVCHATDEGICLRHMSHYLDSRIHQSSFCSCVTVLGQVWEAGCG